MINITLEKTFLKRQVKLNIVFFALYLVQDGRQLKLGKSDRSDKPKSVCTPLLPVAVGVVFVGHSVFLVRRIVLRFCLKHIACHCYGVVHTVAVAAAVTH